MNTIEVINIKKRFSNNEVLKGINLTVKKGEIFGLLGRNGAGKSTLLNILTGLTHKTSGSFKILGIDDSEVNFIKTKIGVMPDVSNLYQHMTAYNFLKYMAGVKGVKLSRQDISLLLNKVDLYSVEKQKIKTFSFGMKKKISIAQALIGYPKLLILDEPTSGLDPESSIKIQNLIRALNEENITIILTSHSLHEIEKISDRIAIIKNGKVGKLGTVTELKKQTSSYFNILIRVDPFLTNSVITKFNLDTNAHLTILDSTGRYLIIESNSEDIIPPFIEFLIKKKFKIFEVKVEEVSLEDIFLSY